MKRLYPLWLLLFPISVCAQKKTEIEKITVNLNLSNANMQRFASELQQQAHVICYYIPETTDSVLITLSGTMTVKAALSRALPHATTGLSFVSDNKGSIYITKGEPLSMELGQKSPFMAKVKKAIALNAANKNTKKAGHHTTTLPAETQLKSSIIDFDENKLFVVGKNNSPATNRATITGYIRARATGEGISHASIAVAGSSIRTISDSYGYYTITLPKGRHVLQITCIGMTDARRQVELDGDGQLPVQMHDYITSLKAVTIASDKSSNVRSTAMGVQKIDIKTIRQIPAIMGEVDILRVLQTLPGVTSAGEGSTGLNVRGGNVDQNLVLLDGATIYNPSHFFGFFSGFNSDLIKDAELYKSSIPVRYGSRLSSVLEVLTREGNHNKLSGSGGIGPLSGHLTLEGPIGKKTSFIVGGRSTYSDWVLQLLPDDQYKRSKASFYDANIKITSDIDNKNSLYFSGYISGDRFRLDGDTLYKYGNKNGIVKWKHIFNNRLYGNFGLGVDRYDFSMSSANNKVDAFRFKFDVAQYHFNTDLIYSPDNKNKIETGLAFVYYKLHPGSYTPLDTGSAIPNILAAEQGAESAVYISDQYTVSPELTIDFGLRYSMFNYLGPHEQNNYIPGQPRDIANITDTTNYGSGKFVKTWHGPEPRISARYSLSNNTSVKGAYNRTRQYIHMLSNSTVITPTDIWKLSDTYFKPEIADQVSLGIYRNFRNNVIETSIEVYYKWMQHALAYKSGANLLLNHHIETDVANADGKAYGVEFLIKKTAGKLNGWLSYTYSRTFLRMHDPLENEPINGGAYYPADYDKPHVVNLIGNYRFSHRFSVSLTSLYSTGRPITLPVARYYMGGSYRVYYADRNQYRIPDYFRTDLSMNIEGNHKVKKLAHSSWTLGVYNMFARRNAYSVYFTSEQGKIQGYKLSIFGTAIPFVTYNFKF